MSARPSSWQGAAGLLLSLAALFSYPLLFIKWPLTRDFPWANLLLFALAAVLIVQGVRHAFGPGRRRWLRIGLNSVFALLSAGVLGLFIFGVFIAPRRLPASLGAPQVGQRAPEFTLVDAKESPVSLQDLLASPANGARATNGVLLIFYRGYW